MKQNHVLIKGHVLYANKGTTIKNVCNHLQSRKVDRIIVRNSHEKEIGYVPLCRILQLLQREKSLCEHLIRQMNLEQIADALHGKNLMIFVMHWLLPEKTKRSFLNYWKVKHPASWRHIATS